MNISALHNINFTSNMPIYHVYKDDKQGNRTELKGKEISGVVKAFVKKLKSKESDEAVFMKNQGTYQNDYKYNPVATSTHFRDSDNDLKFYVMFGNDADIANGLRLDCFHKGNISASTVFSSIYRWLIKPENKKIKLKSTNEELGLVLYTSEQNKTYNRLKGFAITTKSGRIIDEFPNRKNEYDFEEEEEIQELLDDYYASPKTNTKSSPKDTQKLVQGELFELSEIQPREDYVERRADLPIFPIRLKRWNRDYI